MVITTFHMYVFAGLVILGLLDFFLSRYPIFHPIVLLPVVGWFWGELNAGLILGAMLEMVFGIAQLKETRRLNLVLFAGGLALYLNQQTYNINLILSMTLGLLAALGIQLLFDHLRDWLKILFLLVFSAGITLLLPLGRELFGMIPAGFLSQISVAGQLLPWIFFAYAVWGLTNRQRDRKVIIAIPAILLGGILSLELYIWGPLVFVVIYYGLDLLTNRKEIDAIYYLNWALVIIGIYYILFPDFSLTHIWVFVGIVALNILFVVRKFAPLEIYLLIFLAGIILSQGNILH